MSSVKCYRQALALNEQRLVFSPEMLTRRRDLSQLSLGSTSVHDSVYLDAWFLGTHADLGGSNASDGLSLYPLQWMLKEAMKSGLQLGFQMHGHGRPLMCDIQKVIFPWDEFNSFELGTILLPNGIEVAMWDLRESHQTEQYRLRINVAKFVVGNVGFEEKPRRVFDQDQLLGYRRDESTGAFIHPSVYMLQDYYPHLRLGQRLGCFEKQLQAQREQYGFRFTEAKQPWPRQEDVLHYALNHARILVCGENGIGKSTLINKVFGINIDDVRDHVTTISHGQHGEHDIDFPITHPDQKHIIIHDSRGFQPGLSKADGEKNEVQKVYDFLQFRLQHERLEERLHVIWYCVDISKYRFVDDADTDLFKVIDANNSEVPIVLVLTKKDGFKNAIVGDEIGKQMSQMKPGLDMTKVYADAAQKAEDAVLQRTTEFRQRFVGITKSHLIGPIVTAEGDEDCFDALLRATLQDVNERVSALIIAGQKRNVHVKRQSAIKTGMDLFRTGTRTSMIPIPLTTTVAQFTCGSLICKRGLQAFGYDNVNRDLVWATVRNNWDGSLAALAGQVTVAAACIATILVFPPSIILGLASDTIVSAATVTRQARVLVFCIVDVVLTLDKAFWVRAGLEGPNGMITDEDVRAASTWYSGKVRSVHDEIKKCLPILSHTDNTVYKSLFNADKVQGQLEQVIEKYRCKPDESENGS